MSEAYRKKHQSRQSADWLVDADGKPLGLIGPEGKVYQPVIAETGPGGGVGIQLGGAVLQSVVVAKPGIDTTAEIAGALQDMAGVGEVLIAGAHIVNVNGITVPSNSVMRFLPGASLSLGAHNATSYQILRVYDVDSVEIYNPVIDGRKDLNSATTGEWGMGISIRGSRNVRVFDPITNNCWGDGIYIGSSNNFPLGGGLYDCSENVVIKRPRARGCRRQGMSIVSVRGCEIERPVWENTGGVQPEAGCDIEPNHAVEHIEGLKIINPITRNNAGAGILIALNKFEGATKNISIEIVNHYDDGSNVGFVVDRLNPGAGVRGIIESRTPTYERSKSSAFRARGWGANGPLLQVIRPVALNSNTLGGSGAKYDSTYSVYRDPADPTGYSIGGVDIVNPAVDNLTTTAPRPFFAQDDSASPLPVLGVNIIDPLRVTGVTQPSSTYAFRGRVSDAFRAWARTITGTTTLTSGSGAPTLLHDRTSTSNWTLYAGELGLPGFVVENINIGPVRLTPPAGGAFLGQPANAYYQCAGSVGHRMRLTPLGGGIWRVDEMVGTWTLTTV